MVNYQYQIRIITGFDYTDDEVMYKCKVLCKEIENIFVSAIERRVLVYLIIYIIQEKMKNSIMILMVCLLILMTGCEKSDLSSNDIKSTNKETRIESSSNKSNDNREIVYKNKYIKVFSYMKDKETLYKYTIYTKKGEKFYQEKNLYKQPNFKKIDEDLMSVGIGAGTAVYLVKYFDVSNKEISKTFETPLDVKDRNVILFDFEKNSIVVQNIFDKDKYYKDFPLKDVNGTFPISDAKFIGSDKIKVKYTVGNDYKEITDIFYLK